MAIIETEVFDGQGNLLKVEIHEVPERNHQDVARELLEKYSLVVQRAYEDGIPFPQEWKDYGDTLRAIQKGEHPGPLPSKPATYPDGTPT